MPCVGNHYGDITGKAYCKGSVFGQSLLCQGCQVVITKVLVHLVPYDIEDLDTVLFDLRLHKAHGCLGILKIDDEGEDIWIKTNILSLLYLYHLNAII